MGAGTPSLVQGEHPEVAKAWAFPTPVADSERATQPAILRITVPFDRGFERLLGFPLGVHRG